MNCKTRLLARLGSLFGLAFAATVTAQDTAESIKQERLRQMEAPYVKLDYGKSLVEERPSGELVEISFDDLPKRIQGQMYSSLGSRLQWKAHPQTRGRPRKGSDVGVRIFAAFEGSKDDIVEYSWEFLGQRLLAVSSLNAIKLTISLTELQENKVLDGFGASLIERARGFVSEVVRLKGTNSYREDFEIDLPWPESLDDGVMFSSNPQASLRLLARWHWRVDAYVEGETLSILFYKKIPQLMLYQDGSKWFHDEFRALVHKKAREQGITPPATQGE